MSLLRKLSSRFALLATGRVAVLVLGLLATALLTRILGPEGFGHFRTAIAFLGIAVALADLGLASLFVREISAPDADQARLIGNALGLRLVLATVAMIIAILVAFALPLQAQDRLGVVGGAFGFLCYSVHLLLFGLFQQKLRQQGVVVAELSGAILLVLLILLFGRAGASPAWFATAMGMSYVVTLIITVIAARRFVQFRPRLELDVWRRLTRDGAPLAVVWTLSALYTRADIALLAVLNTSVQVGLYGVPSKIYDSLIGIALLFVGMFAPLLANSARRDVPAFQQHLNSALTALSVGVVSMAVALVVSAPELIYFLGGPEFAGGVPVLRFMAMLLVVRSATLLLRETVIALHEQKRLLPIYAVTFVVAFAGFFLLIPSKGGAGAVLAFLAAELVLLLSLSVVVIRAAARLSVFRTPIAIVACGLASGAFAIWLESAGHNIFLRGTLAGAMYVALLFATKAVTIDTLIALRQEIIARKKT